MKVIGLTSSFVEEIVVDAYIPIKVRWEPCTQELSSPIPPYYYRTGDFKKSLVEIGINDKGFMKKVVVTLVDKRYVYFKRTKEEIKISLIEKGLPLIDISSWPFSEIYWDVEKEFKVYIYQDSISLLLNSEEKVISIVESHHVRFFLNDKNSIEKISFFNLSTKEYLRCVNTLIKY